MVKLAFRATVDAHVMLILDATRTVIANQARLNHKRAVSTARTVALLARLTAPKDSDAQPVL
jgi:hypothetical protein